MKVHYDASGGKLNFKGMKYLVSLYNEKGFGHQFIVPDMTGDEMDSNTLNSITNTTVSIKTASIF